MKMSPKATIIWCVIDERAAGSEWAQGSKGCKAAARHFTTIDENDTRSVNLVKRIKTICEV
jgi:hypothetical protein